MDLGSCKLQPIGDQVSFVNANQVADGLIHARVIDFLRLLASCKYKALLDSNMYGHQLHHVVNQFLDRFHVI